MALVMLGGVLLTAGCAEVTVDSTVNPDATIETYEVQINTSTTAYGLLAERAGEQGHDTVGDYLLENNSIDPDNAENYDYDKTEELNNVTMTIRLEGYDPASDSNITLRKEDETMVYRDLAFGGTGKDESGEDSQSSTNVNYTYDYTLNMPGEITNTSSSAEVDGDTAEWHYENRTGNSPVIYAESEISESSSVFGPGFSISGVVVAVAVLVIGMIYRQRGR